MGVSVSDSMGRCVKHVASRRIALLLGFLLLVQCLVGTLQVTVAAPNPIPIVTIELSPSQQNADIGPERSDMVQFNCTVTVQTLNAIRYSVTIEMSTSTGWSAEGLDGFTSMGSGFHSFVIYVGVPSDARADETCNLLVTATCSVIGLPITSKATASSVITVNEYFDATVTLRPDYIEAEAGDTVVVDGTASNTGNTNGSFELVVESCPKSIVALLGTIYASIPAGDSIPFHLTLGLPDSLTPGVYTICVEMHNDPSPGEPLVKDTSIIYVNTNPMRAVLKASPLRVAPGMEVTFDGSSSSTGPGEAKYMFEFGDGSTSGWVVTPMVKHAYAEEGEYGARLAVEGDDGTRSSNDASIQIKVTTEGFKPTAVITEISPDPVHLGEEVTFIGRGEPVGTTTIKVYQWRSSLDGELGTTAILHVSSLSMGTHNITFRVQDQRGTWSEPIARDLRVLPSRDMWQLKVSKPKEGATVSGSTATVEGTASFGTVPIDRVEVRLDGGDWIATSGRAEWTYTLDLTGVADGKHTLEVRARAAGSVSDTVSVTFHTGEEPSTSLVPNVTNSELAIGITVLVVIIVLVLATRGRSKVPSV